MGHRHIPLALLGLATCCVALAAPRISEPALSGTALANALGWTISKETFCGGYYVDPAFASGAWRQDNHIEITGAEGLFSFRGTSAGRGRVTVARTGQEIVADHARLYRDPGTGKLRTIYMSGHVTLREPDNLVIAERGVFDIRTQQESLYDVFYRTTVIRNHARTDLAALKKPRRISDQGMFGRAAVFIKKSPGIFQLKETTYSTCPPLAVAWHLRAAQVHLDKNTGRGTATHARLYIQNVPVLYSPWLNFPIDARRQTGFLPPLFRTSGQSGAWLQAPFYWNMAPNHDMTLTPGYIAKRGAQMSGLFRYLTPESAGSLSISVLPMDRAFSNFQSASNSKYASNTNSYIQAELRRLNQASTTRSSITLRDNTRFNAHWSGSVDYSRVSDDYYLRDLNTNLNEVTNNQLLQEGDLNYEGEYWNFTGRLQGYQALHPLDEVSVVQNQYARLPQLGLNGQKQNGPFGLNWFVGSELTRFALAPTPGSPTLMPVGDRFHVQPGISWPIEHAWYYVIPRLQFALTEYRLSQTTPPASGNPSRSLPIFDTHAGMFFDRDFMMAGHGWRQTLEPEIYYTYVPFRYQNNLPLFDTSTNTLTYDQLFVYNRFNGIDRIGDTSQISYGVTTRLLDGRTSWQAMRAGVGQVLYFKNRLVTLGPPNPDNDYDKSPVTGVLTWQINPAWSVTGSSIWNVRTNAFDNQTFGLAYRPGPGKTINLGYSFVRGGDMQTGDPANSSAGNLSQTDFSFAWPVSSHWSTVGRWTQNWNHHHFQNLLYGLEYDSCCWAVRLVAARAFIGLNPAGTTYMYDTGISLQFALKGLGSIGNSDPGQLLSNSIAGYQSNFGQIA